MASQQVLYGTHTSDEEPNFLIVGEICFPLQETPRDERVFDDSGLIYSVLNCYGRLNQFQKDGGFPKGVNLRVLKQIPHHNEVNKSVF